MCSVIWSDNAKTFKAAKAVLGNTRIGDSGSYTTTKGAAHGLKVSRESGKELYQN
ncbi:uncharacterized protein LOC141859807 [Acropora palmata]|uniref:uncharacterized protein LOC141859807 n=1 Tax=Acropora palmata TaxID=6131 RepID=UPI003DA0A904